MAEISKQALKVGNNQSFPNNNNGSITPTDLRTFNVDMIDSLVDEIGYNIDSSSLNNSIELINQFTASISTSVDLSPLNQATASLQAFTASIAGTNLFTASVNISVTNLNASSASQQVSINALNVFTASIVGTNVFTASVNTSITNLNISSASQQISINSINAATSSFITESETGSFARTNVNNNFSGTQIFNNIAVNGTASIAYLESVTGSAKIIGDAFIILNNDTPAERYAGIIVIDSGSTPASASFLFDGLNNDWFYEYTSALDNDNFGVVLFGPEYNVKGSPLYPTNNRIQKGDGGHHILDSNISDDGSIVSINSNTQITGSLSINGNSALVDGDLAALNTFTQSQQALNTTFATTGSNTFDGNQTISGTTLMGGTLTHSGSGFVSERNQFKTEISGSNTLHQMFAGSQIISSSTHRTTQGAANLVQIRANGTGSVYGSTQAIVRDDSQRASSIGGLQGFETQNPTQYLGIAADNAGYGNSGWAGAGIAVSNADGSDYPVVIGFQTQTTYTDGRVTVLKPLVVSNSLIVTGSASGNVATINVVESTASIDFNTANFFTLSIPTATTTRVVATNIKPGQTVSLLLTQPATTGSLSFATNFDFPNGFAYSASAVSGAKDIVTFVTFDSTTAFATSVKNLL